jgi:hypothetical protein
MSILLVMRITTYTSHSWRGHSKRERWLPGGSDAGNDVESCAYLVQGSSDGDTTRRRMLAGGAGRLAVFQHLREVLDSAGKS